MSNEYFIISEVSLYEHVIEVNIQLASFIRILCLRHCASPFDVWKQVRLSGISAISAKLSSSSGIISSFTLKFTMSL